MSLTKIKIVDKSKNNPNDLFGIGSEKDEFYFVKANEDTKDYFEKIGKRISKGTPVFAYVETKGGQATLVVPGKTENVFKEYEVALNYYKNTPPKGIIISPWNGSGDLFDITYTVGKYDFKLDTPISPEFTSLVNSWNWVLYNHSREVFWEWSKRTPPPKVIREGVIPCESVIDWSDWPIREKMLYQVMDETTSSIAKTAKKENVDLVLIGLFTEDNHTHLSGRIEDLCTVDEQGLAVVNKLRNKGYSGNIVAIKSAPYTIPDTFFNRTALYSLFKQGVIISPSTKQKTLTQILTGGKFTSDYRLDGTPDEIDAYRKAHKLTELDPVRPI